MWKDMVASLHLAAPLSKVNHWSALVSCSSSFSSLCTVTCYYPSMCWCTGFHAVVSTLRRTLLFVFICKQGVYNSWNYYGNNLQFLARDSMLSALYAIARPSVCPSVRLSVRPSVTRVDQSKTVERIIETLSPSDRPHILVFRHQRSSRKSDGFPPWGRQIQGG